MTKKEWLEEQIMCDEWGRPPSLADVPLTIMTRKEALIKQGGDEKSIDKLYEYKILRDVVDLFGLIYSKKFVRSEETGPDSSWSDFVSFYRQAIWQE